MSTTPSIVDQLLAQLASELDMDTLLDKARGALDIPPKDADVSGDTVTITDPVQAALVNEVIAQAAEAKRVRDAAAADYDAAKDLLKEVLGEREILKVHNATVFTNKKSTSIVVDQKLVQSRFPRSIHEDLYVVQERRTALFK